MGGNASGSLNLLCLDPERKVKYYNMYFINGYVFHIKDYGQNRKICNNKVCVNESTFNEFEVDYYGKLEEVIELQYYSKHNRVFLFKWYWYDTTDRKVKLDLYYGLIKINTKTRLRNIDDVFVFMKQYQKVYYTYIFLEIIVLKLIGYPL